MKTHIKKILALTLLGIIIIPSVSFAKTETSEDIIQQGTDAASTSSSGAYSEEQCQKLYGTKCADKDDFGFTSQETMDKELDEAVIKDAEKIRMASGQGFKLPLDFLTLETKDKNGKLQKQSQSIFNNKEYGQYGPLLGTFLRVIDILIYIIGSVAMLTLVVAGIFMIANHGDEAWVTKAKGMMLYSILGVLFALLSFAVVSVIESILS